MSWKARTARPTAPDRRAAIALGLVAAGLLPIYAPAIWFASDYPAYQVWFLDAALADGWRRLLTDEAGGLLLVRTLSVGTTVWAAAWMYRLMAGQTPDRMLPLLIAIGVFALKAIQPHPLAASQFSLLNPPLLLAVAAAHLFLAATISDRLDGSTQTGIGAALLVLLMAALIHLSALVIFAVPVAYRLLLRDDAPGRRYRIALLAFSGLATTCIGLVLLAGHVPAGLGHAEAAGLPAAAARALTGGPELVLLILPGAAILAFAAATVVVLVRAARQRQAAPEQAMLLIMVAALLGLAALANFLGGRDVSEAEMAFPLGAAMLVPLAWSARSLLGLKAARSLIAAVVCLLVALAVGGFPVSLL